MSVEVKNRTWSFKKTVRATELLRKFLLEYIRMTDFGCHVLHTEPRSHLILGKAFFHRICGFKINRIFETLSLGEKSFHFDGGNLAFSLSLEEKSCVFFW